MAGDEDADRLARQTVTLAELLVQRAPEGRPRTPLARSAVAQPHCHQHAIMGTGSDRQVMEAAGLDVEILDAGCCGLAGNFGFEAGHYEVSMACAEDKLLPRIREAEDSTLVLADGFNCRTQVEQSGVGRTPVHLAEVLAAAVRGNRPGAHADTDLAQRPDRRAATGAPPSRSSPRRRWPGAATTIRASRRAGRQLTPGSVATKAPPGPSAAGSRRRRVPPSTGGR